MTKKQNQGIRNIISKLTSFTLDLLFPKYCLGCGTEGFYICPDCFNKIKLNEFSKCYICGRRTAENRPCFACEKKAKLNGLLVAADWEDKVLREIVYQFKYKFIQELSHPLSQTLINFITKYNKTLLNIHNILLIPVPLHQKRFAWRGFNQSELLTNKIGGHFNWPVRSLLKRTRHAPPQVEIADQKLRKQNIEHSFLLTYGQEHSRSIVNGKIIIIIDDVCTTGSTLEECAKVLRPLKPKEIWGLALARG